MGNKKKILFVIDVFLGGGAERVLTTLINNIDKDKFEPVLLVLYDRVDETYLANVNKDVIIIRGNIKQVSQSKRILFKLNSFLFLPVLFRNIRKIRPDIVFCNKFIMNAIAALLIPFFGKITWIARETTSDVVGTIKTKPIQLLYKTFYRGYNVVIAQCEEMKQAYINSFGIPDSKFVIINNPVDTDYIDKKLALSSEVDLPKDKFNLLASGRIVRSKGFDNLLKSFAAIENKGKYHLTILGSPDENEMDFVNHLNEIVRVDQLQNSVNFVGFQHNVPKWLEGVDGFILSSRYEGFPNMLLEALYVGVPAIANRCPGGITEIIEDGVNGYTFEIESDSLEEYLEKIEQTQFDKLLIRKNTKERYGIKTQIQKFEELFTNY